MQNISEKKLLMDHFVHKKFNIIHIYIIDQIHYIIYIVGSTENYD